MKLKTKYVSNQLKNFKLSFKEAMEPIAPAHFAFEVPLSEFENVVNLLKSKRIALLKWSDGRYIDDFETGKKVLRSDFHLPPSVNPDTLQNNNFYIETIFEFNEVLIQNDIEKYTVPSFFQNFIIEPNGRAPYIRIRLDASWQRSNQPEGIVDTNVYFITSPENMPIKNQDKRPLSQTQHYRRILRRDPQPR